MIFLCSNFFYLFIFHLLYFIFHLLIFFFTYSSSGNSSQRERETIPIPFRGVGNRPASILKNGTLVCNLPDHRVTGGCTAIVAVKIMNKLYVANAGERNDDKNI